jgi:hypothetical protein
MLGFLRHTTVCCHTAPTLSPPKTRSSATAPPTSYAAALVAAQQSCAALGAFNFYPDGTINQPEAWTLANQGAAGNADRGALFPIALLGTPQPALNFLPSHPLLTAAGAAAPPAACATIATAPSRRLAAAAPAGAIAGTFSWSVALDGALSASGSAVTLAAATATPPSWTANVWGLADVSCLVLDGWRAA